VPVGEANAYIGPAWSFCGAVSRRGSVRIEGQFEGEIAIDGVLTVGYSGRLTAAVESETVSVAGEIVGDVRGRRLVEVRAGGRVQGDITAPEFNVDDGAEVTGRVQRTGDPDVPGEAPPTVRPPGLGRRARARISARVKSGS
jgi:cytoskeletal protein CcmA (bactofilin family)